MKLNIFIIISFIFWGNTLLLNAQEVHFIEQSRTENPNGISCYASKIDRLNKPYLYTANLQQGLKIYNIENLGSPELVAEIGISEFQFQWVTNVIQYEDRLYLSLGDFQGATRPAGIGIIDVFDPENPAILGFQFFPEYDKGCALIRVKEDVAYLGLMDHGVLAVDISDLDNITDIKHITFDNDFPEPPGFFSKPHARGMEISGDNLFVCYDAGGLRAVDISQPEQAQEIGKYVNEELDPVANVVYNNIFIKEGKGYITLDYCGIEVVDLSDPTDMEVIGLYNPNNCNGFNWVGSPSHTNEIIHDEHSLFVSAGDSEIWSFDTSEGLELNGSFAFVGDSLVTWGLDVYNDIAIGNFINVDPVYFEGLTPYYSNWGGWRLYKINKTTNAASLVEEQNMIIYPSPTSGMLTIESPSENKWKLYNINGELVMLQTNLSDTNSFDISHLAAGVYIIKSLGDNVKTSRIIKK